MPDDGYGATRGTAGCLRAVPVWHLLEQDRDVAVSGLRFPALRKTEHRQRNGDDGLPAVQFTDHGPRGSGGESGRQTVDAQLAAGDHVFRRCIHGAARHGMDSLDRRQDDALRECVVLGAAIWRNLLHADRHAHAACDHRHHLSGCDRSAEKVPADPVCIVVGWLAGNPGRQRFSSRHSCSADRGDCVSDRLVPEAERLRCARRRSCRPVLALRRSGLDVHFSAGVPDVHQGVTTEQGDDSTMHDVTATHAERKGIYFWVWAGLIFLTGVEVVLAYKRVLEPVHMLEVLLVLSVIKAALITLYFMHLNSEVRAMRWLLTISVTACFVLMWLFFFPDAWRIVHLGVK